MKARRVLFRVSAAWTVMSRRAWSAATGFGALLTVALAAQPAAAQKIHSYEPLTMDPYSTIYVNNGSCSAGKILKVHGAPGNHRRKKSCIPMSELQGALGSQPTR